MHLPRNEPIWNWAAEAMPAALAELPRAYRQALLLRDCQGLSYDQIARAMGISRQAVTERIFLARRQLLRRLSGPGEQAVPCYSFRVLR